MTVLTASAPVYAALVINKPPPPGAIALTAPEVGQGWRLLEDYRDDWKPIFPSADATLLRTYVKSGRAVHFFIAYYRSQSDGHEVVNYGNRVYDDRAWIRAGSGSAVGMIEGNPVEIEYTRLLRGRSGRMVWSLRWVDDVYTANPYRAKLLEAKAKLLGGQRAAAQIAIAADYGESTAEATAVLKDFLSSAPPLRPLLARAAGG
jgi:EpsI family protein